MLTILRSSRPFAALTALVLLTATLGPIAPPCTVETEAPCEEQMDHGAMQAQASMPMAHAMPDVPAPEPRPRPAPSSTVGMACCGLNATAASPIVVPAALVAFAAAVLPGAMHPADSPAQDLVTEVQPPGRSPRLHIAYGQFLI